MATEGVDDGGDLFDELQSSKRLVAILFDGKLAHQSPCRWSTISKMPLRLFLPSLTASDAPDKVEERRDERYFVRRAGDHVERVENNARRELTLIIGSRVLRVEAGEWLMK